jgi:hypothetical protein
LAALVVPRSGQLVATGNPYEPYQLIDPAAGGRAGGVHGPFLWDGSAAVVSVPVVRQ